MTLFSVYLIIINLVGFIVMFVDKKRAKEHKWRFRERLFFIIAFLFGGPGVWAGMYVFRHKTKHPKFTMGIPLIIVLEVFVVVFLMCRMEASLY